MLSKSLGLSFLREYKRCIIKFSEGIVGTTLYAEKIIKSLVLVTMRCGTNRRS